MIDRIEFLAQAGRLRLSIPALARKAGLSTNTVRAFLDGGDIKLSHLQAIVEALSGDVIAIFAKVTEAGVAPLENKISDQKLVARPTSTNKTQRES